MTDRKSLWQSQQERVEDQEICTNDFRNDAPNSPKKSSGGPRKAPVPIMRFSLIIMGTLLDEVTYCCNMIRESQSLEDVLRIWSRSNAFGHAMTCHAMPCYSNVRLRRRAHHAWSFHCLVPGFSAGEAEHNIHMFFASNVVSICAGLHSHFFLHDAQHASWYPRGSGCQHR